MTGRTNRAGMTALALAVMAMLLGAGSLTSTSAHAGGGQGGGHGHAGAPDGSIVQTTVLRWRDSWPYGIVDAAEAEAASTHAEGDLVAGEATLVRSADGIHLEVRDDEALKKHAYSIWFQICPDDATFTDHDTQCSLSKLINMNGSGGVAGPHGLTTTFDLAAGTYIPPSDFCEFSEAWLTTPCPAWGNAEVLSGGVLFTSDMALHAPVRIVVKDHGPDKHVKDVGKTLGMNTQQALFNATHRQDGPDCQPARSVCPDAHIGVFAPPAADAGDAAIGEPGDGHAGHGHGHGKGKGKA